MKNRLWMTGWYLGIVAITLVQLSFLHGEAFSQESHCSAHLSSAALGYVEVDSNAGLSRLFPKTPIGRARLLWRPTSSNSSFQLTLAFDVSKTHSQSGPVGGHISGTIKRPSNTDDLKLSLGSRSGRTLVLMGQELQTAKTSQDSLAFSAGFGSTSPAMNDAIRKGDLKVSLSDGRRILSHASFDMTGYGRLFKDVAPLVTKVRDHDPAVCS
jgi:hypothetical protein